jgi:probable phosphoglycerate mutase
MASLILTDGTKISGFVTAEQNQPPRQCDHCVWYKHDHCHNPLVMIDDAVPGDSGKPKPVNDDDCCNGFQSVGKVLVYALRHGTTELNTDNKFRGWVDVPLDEQGRKDAEEAAEFLEDKGITMIYCSDLIRAQETAKIVGEKLGLNPISDYRLRPWNVGSLSGEDKDENKDILDHHIDHPDQPLPQGESLDEFGERTQEAIDYYLDEARSEGVKLLVFHTSNVIQLENLCKGKGADGRPEANDSVHPGGIVVVTEKKGKLSSKPVLKDNGEGEYGS